jgi:hypothetical protein
MSLITKAVVHLHRILNALLPLIPKMTDKDQETVEVACLESPLAFLAVGGCQVSNQECGAK